MRILLSTLVLVNISHVVPGQASYPATQRGQFSDRIFNRQYDDPYRWLENMESDSVSRWFHAQGRFTDSVLSGISGKEDLLSEWKKISDSRHTSYFQTVACNDILFHLKKGPVEENARIYRCSKTGKKEEVIFDPGTYMNGRYQLRTFKPSFDGQYLLLDLTLKGSEIGFIRILSVNGRRLLSDSISPASGGEWLPGGKSITYVRLNAGNVRDTAMFKNLKVYLHQIGHEMTADRVIFGREAYPELALHADNFVGCNYSIRAPEYLFASAGNDDGYHVCFTAKISDLDKPRISWKTVSVKDDRLVKKIAFIGNRVYAISGKNTSCFKLVSSLLDGPSWKTVVEEKEGLVLENFEVLKDYLILRYSDGVNTRLVRYDLASGKTKDIALPQNGNAFTWSASPLLNECYVNLTSWSLPLMQYRFLAESSQFVISEYYEKPDYPASYYEIESEEVEVKSHDGTMVPLSIIYRKGMKRDGSNICFAEGYGAYGWSYSSFFNPHWSSLIARGVVMAVAHVRGGGEKGVLWEKGGYKTTKKNTWRDFIACCEYLIANRYTNKEQLIGSGVSAGGIMIGRAITERPELFRAAICSVPVLNTLRLHKMPNGSNLAYQFGSIADSAECAALAEMDATRHLRTDISYPAVICITGLQDPRVSPWQSGKFIAGLQASEFPSHAALLKVDTAAGHFASLSTLAECWSFALNQCGHPLFQKKQQ